MTTLNHLLPEDNDGNIEYKWKLCDVSPNKIHQLMTQMLFRLTEGGGYAEYYLGVSDNGNARGILKSEVNMTLYNIFECCRGLGSKVLYYKIYVQPNNRYCIHLKVVKLDLPCDKICV